MLARMRLTSKRLYEREVGSWVQVDAGKQREIWGLVRGERKHEGVMLCLLM